MTVIIEINVFTLVLNSNELLTLNEEMLNLLSFEKTIQK